MDEVGEVVLIIDMERQRCEEWIVDFKEEMTMYPEIE